MANVFHAMAICDAVRKIWLLPYFVLNCYILVFILGLCTLNQWPAFHVISRSAKVASYFKTRYYLRSVVPEAGIEGKGMYYIPQYLWGVIACSCPWYPLILRLWDFVRSYHKAWLCLKKHAMHSQRKYIGLISILWIRFGDLRYLLIRTLKIWIVSDWCSDQSSCSDSTSMQFQKDLAPYRWASARKT